MNNFIRRDNLYAGFRSIYNNLSINDKISYKLNSQEILQNDIDYLYSKIANDNKIFINKQISEIGEIFLVDLKNKQKIKLSILGNINKHYVIDKQNKNVFVRVKGHPVEIFINKLKCSYKDVDDYFYSVNEISRREISPISLKYAGSFKEIFCIKLFIFFIVTTVSFIIIKKLL